MKRNPTRWRPNTGARLGMSDGRNLHRKSAIEYHNPLLQPTHLNHLRQKAILDKTKGSGGNGTDLRNSPALAINLGSLGQRSNFQACPASVSEGPQILIEVVQFDV